MKSLKGFIWAMKGGWWVVGGAVMDAEQKVLSFPMVTPKTRLGKNFHFSIYPIELGRYTKPDFLTIIPAIRKPLMN